jgi:hypothetical protein
VNLHNVWTINGKIFCFVLHYYIVFLRAQNTIIMADNQRCPEANDNASVSRQQQQQQQLQ